MSIDFGARFWFKCEEHGRFSLQDVHPDKSYEDLLVEARKVEKAECPKCGKLCPACPCSGERQAASQPIKATKDQVMPVHQIGCTYCVIGTICKYCGTDCR